MKTGGEKPNKHNTSINSPNSRISRESQEILADHKHSPWETEITKRITLIVGLLKCAMCQTKEVALLAYKQAPIREGRAGAEQQERAGMGKAPPRRVWDILV